jgi:hypothetical protein
MANEYKRLTEKAELTYEEALALKEEIQRREENRTELAADLIHPARWHITTRMSALQAVSFLNAPPLTQPGEACVTSRPDGTVDVYWFGTF